MVPPTEDITDTVPTSVVEEVAAAPPTTTTTSLPKATSAGRPRPLTPESVAPPLPTAPAPTSAPPPAVPTTAVTTASSCRTGAPVTAPGLWVAGRNSPLRSITDAALDAYAWAPDATGIAWISGGAVQTANARKTGAVLTLASSWRLVPKVGWTDKSDAVIVAGQHPDGRTGIWHLPVTGDAPRLLRATSGLPVDLSVGRSIKRSVHDTDNPDRYRHVIAFVADDKVETMDNQGFGVRTVATGAFDTVVFDRLGENLAYAGRDGIGVSLYPKQPGALIARGGSARPVQWSYLYDRILVRDGAIAYTLTPDGATRVELGATPRGALFAPYHRQSYAAEETPSGTNIVRAEVDGSGRRVMALGAAHPAADGYGVVSWVTDDTQVVCATPDTRSGTHFALAQLDGRRVSLPPQWTAPQETSPSTPEPLLAIVAA